MTDSMLIPHETYEVHKVHIGALQKSADMKPFLSDEQGDGSGLHLIDLEHTDSRMRIVAQFLNRYDPSRILVVSARQYGQRPARMFAQSIGAKHIVGRFIPGTLTNPRLRTYIEPELIVVTDPRRINSHSLKRLAVVCQSLPSVMRTTTFEMSIFACPRTTRVARAFP